MKKPKKPDPKKWMSAEQAIKRVMDVTGCNEIEAAEKLAKNVKDGKLTTTQFPMPEKKDKILSPAEAVRRFRYEPETMSITLADFARRFRMTAPELLGELQSGRLVARAGDPQALLEMAFAKAGVTKRGVDMRHFIVTGDAINAWLFNPQTPTHLISRPQQH